MATIVAVTETGLCGVRSCRYAGEVAGSDIRSVRGRRIARRESFQPPSVVEVAAGRAVEMNWTTVAARTRPAAEGRGSMCFGTGGMRLWGEREDAPLPHCPPIPWVILWMSC